MLKFICKRLLHSRSARSAVRTSYAHGMCVVRICPYSTSLQSVGNSPNQHFVVTYLVSSCGLSLEKAISASKYLKFGARDKPDSVLAFFESHGFTKSQIEKLVRIFPSVLLCDPEKTLLPKLQFFKSKGMSTAEVNAILSAAPDLFKRSLENQIIPSFEFFNNFLQSQEKTLSLLKRTAKVLVSDREANVTPNIEILKEAGLHNNRIAVLLTYQPRTFLTTPQKFREVVDAVKKMGFNPSQMAFAVAVHAMRSMTKSTWQRKLDVYKKWGWSEEDIIAAFRRHPWCMVVSEDKIMKVMDYLVNKMGWDSCSVVRRPVVMSYSLERRIIPRCTVYEVLSSKGLINDSSGRLSILDYSEKRFLKLLESHGEEAPRLLKLYKEKLALAK